MASAANKPRSPIEAVDSLSLSSAGGIAAWLVVNWCRNILAASAEAIAFTLVFCEDMNKFEAAAAAAAIPAEVEVGLLNNPGPVFVGSTTLSKNENGDRI